MGNDVQHQPIFSIRGGFLKSCDNNVAFIRAIGFDTHIKIFRSSFTQYQTPFTLLIENVRGQDVQIDSEEGDIHHIIRSNTSVMCEVTGHSVQKINVTYPTPPEEFDFLLIGDVHGMFHQFQELIEAANALNPLFVMANGDMTHSGRLEDYHVFAEMTNYSKVPVFTSLGNHDKRARGGRTTYRRMMAPFYYSFSVNKTTCIVLDSSRKRGLQKFQYKWLERELQLARQQRHRILVLLHRPPICPKYNYLAFSASTNAWRFVSLMEQYDVELVIGSHVHVFSEFYKRGVRYVITGGGGGALWQTQNVHHYVHVFVKKDNIEVRKIQLPTPEAKVSQRIKDVLKFNWEHHVSKNARLKRQIALLGTLLLLTRSQTKRHGIRWRKW